MDLLTARLETQLQEKVLPWLFEKVESFILEDEQVNKNAYEIIEIGLKKS
jgi:hypothetical protein